MSIEWRDGGTREGPGMCVFVTIYEEETEDTLGFDVSALVTKP